MDTDEERDISNFLNQLDKKVETIKVKESPTIVNQANSSPKSGSNRLRNFASGGVTKKDSGFTPSKLKNNAEERYPWLVNVLDANKNPPDHPDYDIRTLYIPQSAWNKFTPFERQFWEIKSTHYDTVVFFKKGKFYELYEDDAIIGHQKFDLKVTDRVNMKMAGFPEGNFEFWAGKFIAQGYKVAKVDQMESAVGKTLREKENKGRKTENVIRRELTSILTKGTLVDSNMIRNDESNYCLALKQVNNSFGVALVDTSMAEFRIGAIYDDAQLSKLETFFLQYKPKEIVYEKGRITNSVLKLLKLYLPDVLKNPIAPELEFYDHTNTLMEIKRNQYFGTEDVTQWPLALNEIMKDQLSLSAFGGLTYYLQTLKLDKDLISLKNIHTLQDKWSKNTLLLDGQTLINLQILENSDEGKEGTLFNLINHAVTPSGKRLVKLWICHPLRDINLINQRLDAIQCIMDDMEIQEFSKRLVGIPDLERILSRIHAGSINIKQLLTVIKAFKEIQLIFNELKPLLTNSQSLLLKKIVNDFPDLTEKLSYFELGFDHELAIKEGIVVPFAGVEQKYDNIENKIKEVETQFQVYLNEQKKALKNQKLVYKDINREVCLIEAPADLKIPNNWIKVSQTKAVKRYRTPFTIKLVKEYEETKEIRTGILKEIQREVLFKFDQNYKTWMKAVNALSTLDAIFSFYKAAILIGEPCTRPKFKDPATSDSHFKLVNARHPCLFQSTDFIPNDVKLGGSDPNVLLLTGPNMGGKSTILRQICIIIIMAQVGCFVPAEYCELTPFDSIFTRIGANDNILAGQSTFMVELSETSRILKEATKNSLIILDELGRGTSTFDGYSIAYSVLYYLLQKIQCLGLFSTHYHMLTNEFINYPKIKMMHMDCLVLPNSNKVQFLYKLKQGVCNKSYGMNVASMAGIPDLVIQLAEKKANEFDEIHKIESNQEELPLALLADLSNLIQNLDTENQNQDYLAAWISHLKL
ncbi:DNA mismatch repair protein Msh6 [Neoconidiobolus thromboides FSU 785]|nr:DNA mismatch repair protein Msh6 [Neoconidiobolus thromboides FSU 785]